VDQVAYAAVVLAGGAARRLGGAVKPALAVGGRPMLDRVLAAVADAAGRVVVGPPELPVPAEVVLTREDPPGGGPVAAAAAGLAALAPGLPAQVALLAADLPLLDAHAVAVLRAALADRLPDEAPREVAVFVDAEGRRQSLCGVWRADALSAALDRLAARRGASGAAPSNALLPEAAPRGALAGASMRALFDGVRVTEVTWAGAGPPPWFDCDTDADLRRAEEWTA
jgi:molybdopterin-guanine dinucleotide biosynthesis protein A